RVSWQPPRQLEHLAGTKHGRLQRTARGFSRQRIPDLRQVGLVHLDAVDTQDDVAAEWNVAVAQVYDHRGASQPELLAGRVLRHRFDDVARGSGRQIQEVGLAVGKYLPLEAGPEGSSLEQELLRRVDGHHESQPLAAAALGDVVTHDTDHFTVHGEHRPA